RIPAVRTAPAAGAGNEPDLAAAAARVRLHPGVRAPGARLGRVASPGHLAGAPRRRGADHRRAGRDGAVAAVAVPAGDYVRAGALTKARVEARCSGALEQLGVLDEIQSGKQFRID